MYEIIGNDKQKARQQPDTADCCCLCNILMKVMAAVALFQLTKRVFRKRKFEPQGNRLRYRSMKIYENISKTL
jgi:hypothetical protein